MEFSKSAVNAQKRLDKNIGETFAISSKVSFFSKVTLCNTYDTLNQMGIYMYLKNIKLVK